MRGAPAFGLRASRFSSGGTMDTNKLTRRHRRSDAPPCEQTAGALRNDIHTDEITQAQGRYPAHPDTDDPWNSDFDAPADWHPTTVGSGEGLLDEAE
jgi:hypothetical protein